MVDVDMTVGSVKLNRFTEYRIDIDLDADADVFDMVLGNPGGVHSGLLNRFDAVDIKIGGAGAIKGIVDEISYIVNDSGSLIRISGRDNMSKLVDCDAIPGTKVQVSPGAYAQERCGAFGIPIKSESQAPVLSKIIIGTGESEISVLNNILYNSRERIWYIYDTAYVGKWATDASPTYSFTRGKGGIPIKSMTLTENASNTKTEVRVYGSMSGGIQKIAGIAKNDALIAKGINRIQTKTSANNDIASKLTSSATKDIQDALREDIKMEVTVKTDRIIRPNTTAMVTDEYTGISGTWFIKSVRYQMGLRSGSETVVTMIPDDAMFPVLWSGGSASKKSVIPFDELIDQIRDERSKPAPNTGE